MTETFGEMESKHRRAFKPQDPHWVAMAVSEAPPFTLIDQSEPEREVHPDEDACDVCSTLEGHSPVSSIQKCVSQENVQKEVTNSREVHLRQELFKCASTLPFRAPTTSFENEKGGEEPTQKLSLNTPFRGETETSNSEVSDDEKEEGAFSSSRLLKKVSEEGGSGLEDNILSTRITELENDKKILSVPTFDTKSWSEDGTSICLDLEGTDSEIQIAVDEIRREAEKIDVILMLDKFKTLQIEFDSLTKKYSSKTMETEDLKIQLQNSENKAAQLELDRDLYQADAAKLQEDLKTIVSKMFDISMYESVEEKKAGSKEYIDKENMDSNQYNQGSAGNFHPAKYTSHSSGLRGKILDSNADRTLTTSSPRETMRILGLIEHPRHDPCLIHTSPRSQRSHLSDAGFSSLLSNFPGKDTIYNDNIFRKRNHHMTSFPNEEIFQTKPDQLNSMSKEFKRTVGQYNQASPDIDTEPSCLITETEDEEKETESKRCGILFWRRSKQKSYSREDVSLLKHQVCQLHKMVNTSLLASEKLRKRLTNTTQYYEEAMSGLQTKLAKVNAERSRTQVDLVKMISQIDLERRLEKSKFEFKLSQKDNEIARLKGGDDQGEV